MSLAESVANLLVARLGSFVLVVVGVDVVCLPHENINNHNKQITDTPLAL